MSWKEQAMAIRMQVEGVTSGSLGNDGSSALDLHFLILSSTKMFPRALNSACHTVVTHKIAAELLSTGLCFHNYSFRMETIKLGRK